MDFGSRRTRSRLPLTGRPETIFEIVITCLCVSSVASQYGDFYTNLEALFSGSNVNPAPTTTRAPRLTPRPFVRLGQLLSLDQPVETPKPKQTPAPPPLNRRVDPTWGAPARTGDTRAPPAPNALFTMMNLNSWQDIPPNLFAPSQSHSVAANGVPPTSQSGTKSGSSWQGISFSDTGPGQSLGWDYSANGLDHGSNTGLESGNMVGGAAGGAQEPFLPLADHSPGSTMADQPGQMADWSAPPVSKDTYKYDDEPTPKPKPLTDGESMAKAILRGQVRRWQWNYSTTLLQGEISGRGYGGHYDNSVQCCHRLPYICGVDGMCVIDKNECNEFCICASNPTMPHCVRDVIPRIKKTMAVLEKKILERVSIELNLPVPAAIAQASLPLLATTDTTASTTSTRRPVPFVLSRQPRTTTTATTTKGPYQSLVVTPQQTTKKSPTLMSQTKTGALLSQSRDLTPTQTHNSPVAPSTSTTERTTHQAAEETRNYNRFIYHPLASTTTASPTSTPWRGVKTARLTTEPTSSTTTTRRPLQSTMTEPVVNPFQINLPTITRNPTDSVPDVDMALRFLGTKSSLYATTVAPPPEASIGLRSAPKTTSFMDSMMLQPDGTVGGNTHNVASSGDNDQVAGMTFADSAFGMLEVPIGSSGGSDPHHRASFSPNLDSNVFSTTSLSETTIKETTTQASTEGLSLTVVFNSTLKSDSAGTSASNSEKPILVTTEQTLVSLSESGSIQESANLQISTASNSGLNARETPGVVTKGATENVTSDEGLITISELSVSSSDRITNSLTESDPEVSDKSNVLTRSTSTVTTTAANTPISGSAYTLSATAANALNSTLTYTSSATAANALNSTLTYTSSATAANALKLTYTSLSTAADAPNSTLTYTSSPTAANALNSTLPYTSLSTAAHAPNSTLTYTSSATAAHAPNSTLTYTSSATAANALNSTLTYTSLSTAADAPNSTLTYTSSSTAANALNSTLTFTSLSTAAQAPNSTLTYTPSATAANELNSTLTYTSSSAASSSPNYTLGVLSLSTASHLQQQETSVDSRGFTVRITSIDPPATSGVSADTTTQSDGQPTATTGQLNTTSLGSVTTAVLPNTTGSPPFNATNTRASPTVDGYSAPAPKETGGNTTTPTVLSGSDSGLDASPQNRSELVDGAQEEDFMAWFNDSQKYPLQNVGPSVSSAPRVTPADSGDSGDRAAPCGYDCDKKGGRCLLGEDFKPHCVIMDGDPCDHFRCINGLCALTDGLHVCKCGEGWTGTFCEQPCSVDCGEHGTCGRVGDNMTGCICEFNYTGDRCGDKKLLRPTVTEISVPVDGLKVWEVAVVAVVTAVCLGLVFVLLPYTLWRRQWLPMRQLVFYFQEYEDDDDKEYDAFISYKSTPRDERFILHHLYPRLEKELDFRLCLHFRDFPPGEPIANNIIHAIENSRRTIMVLSPSYVASEWCRMEYQKAQHEMLRLKHKIIPIVLEDVSSMPEMDANLRTIIDTVTYIEWPGEEEPSTSKRITKFWKLLELSMPKKKGLSRSLSSLGSCSSDLPLTSVSKTCFNSIVTSLLSDDVFTSSSLKSCTSSVGKLSVGGSTCGGGGDRKSSGGGGSSAGVKTNSDGSASTKNVDSGSELSPVSEKSTVSLRSKELFSENFVSSPLTHVVCRNVSVGLPRPRTETDLCKKEVETTSGPGTGARKGSVPLHVGQSPSQLGQSPEHVGQSPVQVDTSSPLVGQSSASPPVKNSPVVVRSKPQVSSDDFIVEIRETGAQGKQIKVTSRPPRKYASQLLV